jgi:lipoprotein-anchoring transpeptidase ErfK/SrfK
MAPPFAVMTLRFPLMLVGVVLVSGPIGWALSAGAPRVLGGVPRSTSPSRALPRGWSYLAVARKDRLAIYRRPAHSSRPTLTLGKQISAGAPLTALVRRLRGHWAQIYLPVRPDGATGWVHIRFVKLETTAYALAVRLRTHRLLLSISGQVVHSFAIGVGRAVTPTPIGTYFVTELLKQRDPGGLYGPYAFGLSAYSGVFKHFGRGGDGQIGIHGTNEPQLVGRNVSHGCIRLRNPDMVWLTKRLPLGTPVTIGRE